MPSTIVANSFADLALVHAPGVQAVILAAGRRDAWEAEVASAVEHGAYVIERFTVEVLRPETLVHELERRLPEAGLEWATRLALIDDLAGMAERLASIAPCSALMLRLFTEAPTRHCGFHVDTVPSGCTPVGLLKIYNGCGTLYVEAEGVASVRGFYDYLGARERWSGEHGRMGRAGDRHGAAVARDELDGLDRSLPFLRPGAQVHEVPASAQVAFKLLDVRDHGRDHPPELAWIHCSPMEGLPRLVANFTPLDGPPARRL